MVAASGLCIIGLENHAIRYHCSTTGSMSYSFPPVAVFVFVKWKRRVLPRKYRCAGGLVVAKLLSTFSEPSDACILRCKD